MMNLLRIAGRISQQFTWEQGVSLVLSRELDSRGQYAQPLCQDWRAFMGLINLQRQRYFVPVLQDLRQQKARFLRSGDCTPSDSCQDAVQAFPGDLATHSCSLQCCGGTQQHRNHFAWLSFKYWVHHFAVRCTTTLEQTHMIFCIIMWSWEKLTNLRTWHVSSFPIGDQDLKIWGLSGRLQLVGSHSITALWR